ncbi:MAG: sulfatase-like hydrolase/transferase, partial [Planctomycetes bacterium]|nr:sulfatase-like hydrolase/transferase [Planctomycetota bacterium]
MSETRPETPPDPRRRTRRQFLKAAGLSAAAACALAKGTPAMPDTAPPARRPNLIYVLADQLGTTRCGYAGDAKARTPVLDGFAAQGIDFRQAVSNTPVCAAYRASLLTGKYATSTGMVINELRMRTDHECFGHVLTRAGYRTGYVGKWHLYANQLGNHQDPKNSFVPPGPDRLGFDGYWAAYNFHHEYYKAYYHTNSPEKISYGDGVYEPDGQTDLAIDYLGRAAKAGEPFALFLSYGTPHDPWGPDNVPPEYLRLFDEAALGNPPNYQGENDPYADGWARLSPAERRRLPAWRRGYYYYNATKAQDALCCEPMGL